MFNAHTDTVDVEGMRDPFSGDVRQGKVYGRGAVDMKGSVAAMLSAMRTLAASGVRLHGDVVFAAVADEEHGSLGTRDVIRLGPKVDAAIVTEVSELCLSVDIPYVS